eukprot:Phypoly_transcript_12283.p1 GENE.Phypoly_transcript_12283~~Phypoly_transcript_12283.p1  ORF type:complete len:347 (+),score=29.96 Phypoly_transcript_12283:78-1118(+)
MMQHAKRRGTLLFSKASKTSTTTIGISSTCRYASTTKETIHLVDGTPWIFKSYLSVPVSLLGPNNMYINAMYALSGGIVKYIAEHRPRYIGFFLDPEGATYRCAISGNSRDIKKCIPFPKELKEQLPKITELISKGFSIPVIQYKDYDADAVIHKYTQVAVSQNHPVTLVTEDLRLYQLISHTSQVTAWAPRKSSKLGNFLDEDEVLSRYGVPPNLLSDFHVLTGSSRFELPGIEGFKGTHAHTQKVTTSFLNMYGDLEHLISNLDILKEKSPQFYEYIAPNVELIKEGIKKYTLHPAPIDADLSSLKFDKMNTEFLIKRLREYDFKTILKKLPVLGVPETLVATK